MDTMNASSAPLKWRLGFLVCGIFLYIVKVSGLFQQWLPAQDFKHPYVPQSCHPDVQGACGFGFFSVILAFSQDTWNPVVST